MIEFIDNLDEDSDFYQFKLNGESRPDSIGDALWSDGTILQINPAYMDMEQWSELKRTLTGNSLRSILGLFRQMGHYVIPSIYDIPRKEG